MTPRPAQPRTPAPHAVGLSAPDITEAEIEAVTAVLRSGRLALGPEMRAFENMVAQRAGRQHGIAVNSGTSGLHLCVKALGLQPGDEVITTPFSFVATTNCLLFEGIRPVFVDVDPETYNLDPERLETALTDRTRAILPVEVFGNVAHFDVYEQFARERGLWMIEDCCEALGASLDARPAGSFGDCGVFAFYPNKQITTGEGGVIVTDSDELRDLCVSLRNQGRDSNAWLSHGRLGYNYRMSELQAAVGRVQMERLEEILARRRQVAAWYDELLRDVPEVHVPPRPARQVDRASWFVYVIRLSDALGEPGRAAVVQYLRDRGVQCGLYFPPIHLQPYVRQRLGTRPGDFPVCEAVASRTIALPFGPHLVRASVERVAAALRESLRHCLQ